MILAVIGLLAYRLNSPEAKAKSGVERIQSERCRDCTSVWKVTLYTADGWFDTGIKLKKGESIHVYSYSGNLMGSGELLIKLNGKEERCCVGRSPIKFDQNLILRNHGRGDTGLFREYSIAEVTIKPWEF